MQLQVCSSCTACSIAQKKGENTSKADRTRKVFLWEPLRVKIYREESHTAHDYSYTALLCNAKMPKMAVKVKMFFQPKAPFWGLGFSFVLNPKCLQDSIHTCWGGFLPSVSEHDNESKVPSLLLSKVIMENCRVLPGAVRCLHSALRKSSPKTGAKANFSRLKTNKQTKNSSWGIILRRTTAM